MSNILTKGQASLEYIAVFSFILIFVATIVYITLTSADGAVSTTGDTTLTNQLDSVAFLDPTITNVAFTGVVVNNQLFPIRILNVTYDGALLNSTQFPLYLDPGARKVIYFYDIYNSQETKYNFDLNITYKDLQGNQYNDVNQIIETSLLTDNDFAGFQIDEPLADDLVLYFDFEEDFADDSGYQHTSTASTGISRTAVSGDYKLTVDGFETQNVTASDAFDIDDEFTLFIYAQSLANPSWYTVLNKSSDFYVRHQWENGVDPLYYDLVFSYNATSSLNSTVSDASAAVASYVVNQHNATHIRAQGYVNGVLTNDQYVAGIMNMQNSNNHITLGNGFNAGGGEYLDDIMLWTRALTDYEIAAVYRRINN